MTNQERVIEETNRAVAIAIEDLEKNYPEIRRLENINIVFSNQLGTKAGTANTIFLTVTYNSTLLEENLQHFIVDTVYHEVAHIISRLINPFAKSSHNPVWKYIMEEIFQLEASVHHSYNIDSVVSGNRYKYMCMCGKSFNLSKRMHNSILTGRNRICTSCNDILVFIEKL